MCRYTFLLPAYKSQYFEASLNSIKSQTFRDFRVIVSDDCSPEPLKQIYDSVCRDDSRFQYRRNEKNIGGENLVSHWNLLVELCDTEYLILASDDDVYEPNYLEEMNNLVSMYPDSDILRARVRKIDDKGNVIYEEGLYKEHLTQLEYIAQNYNNTSIHCMAHYIIRTKKLIKEGLFPNFPNAWFSDDASALLLSKNGAINSSLVLFNFRISGLSVSTKEFDQKRTTKLVQASLDYDLWFKKFMEDVKSVSTEEKNLLEFIWYQHRSVVSSFYSWSVNCSWKDFWCLCRQAKKQGIHTIGCKVAFVKNLLSIR